MTRPLPPDDREPDTGIDAVLFDFTGVLSTSPRTAIRTSLDDGVEMVGVEAGGRSSRPGDHAARFLEEGAGVGVLHGTRTYLLQDDAGNVLPTHSISAGLDYPAVGPEHALLRDEGRVRYDSVTDDEALEILAAERRFASRTVRLRTLTVGESGVRRAMVDGALRVGALVDPALIERRADLIRYVEGDSIVIGQGPREIVVYRLQKEE